MAHHERSAFDSDFLNIVKQWFTVRDDLFVVARYAQMAGAKEYFWYRKFESFQAQLERFRPQTHVIVFRDDQFPIRGVVDDKLIHRALEFIPNNTEAMAVNAIEPPDGCLYVWPIDSHVEMLETLQDLVGEYASVGLYAPWHEHDNERMISALIPLPDGSLKRGAYQDSSLVASGVASEVASGVAVASALA